MCTESKLQQRSSPLFLLQLIFEFVIQTNTSVISVSSEAAWLLLCKKRGGKTYLNCNVYSLNNVRYIHIWDITKRTYSVHKVKYAKYNLRSSIIQPEAKLKDVRVVIGNSHTAE